MHLEYNELYNLQPELLDMIASCSHQTFFNVMNVHVEILNEIKVYGAHKNKQLVKWVFYTYKHQKEFEHTCATCGIGTNTYVLEAFSSPYNVRSMTFCMENHAKQWIQRCEEQGLSKHWKAHLLESIKQHYPERSIREIALECGVGTTTAYRLMKEAGIECLGHQKLSRSKKEQLYPLIKFKREQENTAIQTIADELGVSYTYVYYIVKEIDPQDVKKKRYDSKKMSKIAKDYADKRRLKMLGPGYVDRILKMRIEEDTLTERAIAKVFNCSKNLIHNIRVEYKIP